MTGLETRRLKFLPGNVISRGLPCLRWEDNFTFSLDEGRYVGSTEYGVLGVYSCPSSLVQDMAETLRVQRLTAYAGRLKVHRQGRFLLDVAQLTIPSFLLRSASTEAVGPCLSPWPRLVSLQSHLLL